MTETETLPFVQGSDTSKAAAVSMGKAAKQMRQQVLECIQLLGPMTDEQVQDLLKMNPSTERPRRIELVQLGLVLPYGKSTTRSGRVAITWKVAEFPPSENTCDGHGHGTTCA